MGNGQAPREGRRRVTRGQVPHVQGDGDHGVSQERGTVEKAAQFAAHESTRTTQLYNRTDDELTLDEIERIMI